MCHMQLSIHVSAGCPFIRTVAQVLDGNPSPPLLIDVCSSLLGPLRCETWRERWLMEETAGDTNQERSVRFERGYVR